MDINKIQIYNQILRIDIVHGQKCQDATIFSVPTEWKKNCHS